MSGTRDIVGQPSAHRHCPVASGGGTRLSACQRTFCESVIDRVRRWVAEGRPTRRNRPLNVVSCYATDGSGNEFPIVALVPVEPGAALHMDDPTQIELAKELEWHYRPPFVPVEGGE